MEWSQRKCCTVRLVQQLFAGLLRHKALATLRLLSRVYSKFWQCWMISCRLGFNAPLNPFVGLHQDIAFAQQFAKALGWVLDSRPSCQEIIVKQRLHTMPQTRLGKPCQHTGSDVCFACQAILYQIVRGTRWGGFFRNGTWPWEEESLRKFKKA